MRIRVWQLLLAGLFVATPSLASYDSKPSLPTPSSTSGNATDALPAEAQAARQQALPYYKDAYDDVMKGSKELAAGKDKSAKKRFDRARDHSREAAQLDSTYYEAWNLVGFTSRKLGDYPGSFAAYQVALRLKPDFALAREYYGEGLLETGDFAGAMQQFEWLKKIGDQQQLAELQKSIDKYRAAHPEVAARADSSAQADSTAHAALPAPSDST